MDNIVVAKLISGETVIGKMVNGSIQDGFAMIMHGRQLGITPYMAPFEKGTKGSEFKPEHIIDTRPADDILLEAYIEVKTGLSIGKPSGIIT